MCSADGVEATEVCCMGHLLQVAAAFPAMQVFISTEGSCMLFILLGESKVIAASGPEKKNQAVQQKEIALVHTKL
jgi:hypothetical protein